MSNVTAGMLFSLIGYWFFKRGKREANYTVMTIGIVLMVYTLFTKTSVQSWVVGTVLSAGAYFFW